MKKVFFALTALTVLALASCNNKPAEPAVEENAAPATEQVEATAPATETAPATGDSTAAAAPAAQ
ncbi:MAG: hypothetical protein JNK66_02650 [Chitinophagales bacterium]|nr:hypothetical protein [Chitinophagales bacterium]